MQSVPESTGARILHVEDEPQNRALLRAIMARTDRPELRAATLLEAPDLATARLMLAGQTVDLVLLDVRLPDGNGLALAREIQEAHGAARPTVIVMSASVLPSEQKEALESGADAFLSKPYLPSDLVGRIVDALAQPAGRPSS